MFHVERLNHSQEGVLIYAQLDFCFQKKLLNRSQRRTFENSNIELKWKMVSKEQVAATCFGTVKTTKTVVVLRDIMALWSFCTWMSDFLRFKVREATIKHLLTHTNKNTLKWVGTLFSALRSEPRINYAVEIKQHNFCAQ